MVAKFTSCFYRLFFTVAFLLLLIAVIDWIMRLFGWTLSWVSYEPGRMIEFSSIFMLASIVFLLRQIRDVNKNS
jgi:hypothetical protein